MIFYQCTKEFVDKSTFWLIFAWNGLERRVSQFYSFVLVKKYLPIKWAVNCQCSKFPKFTTPDGGRTLLANARFLPKTSGVRLITRRSRNREPLRDELLLLHWLRKNNYPESVDPKGKMLHKVWRWGRSLKMGSKIMIFDLLEHWKRSKITYEMI